MPLLRALLFAGVLTLRAAKVWKTEAGSKYADPRSRRAVGTQIETPTVRVGRDNRSIIVSGYQNYKLNTSGSIVSRLPVKYEYVKSLAARLHDEDDCKSLVDIGANSGLTSLISLGAGMSRIRSLDHDPECVQTLRQVVSWAHLGRQLTADTFDFGEPISGGPFDIVFCGALIHWVFCRTSHFNSSFDAIFSYLFAHTSKFLVIEWVDPADMSVRNMQGPHWPAHCFKDSARKTHGYHRLNFEQAAARFADKIDMVAPLQKTRMIYTFRKRAGLPAHGLASDQVSGSSDLLERIPKPRYRMLDEPKQPWTFPINRSASQQVKPGANIMCSDSGDLSIRGTYHALTARPAGTRVQLQRGLQMIELERPRQRRKCGAPGRARCSAGGQTGEANVQQGGRSIFLNREHGIVMKIAARGMVDTKLERPKREVCTLNRLRPYSGFPVLLCVTGSAMVMGLTGVPLSQANLPADVFMQLADLLEAMRCEGVHHGDSFKAYKDGRVEMELMVDRRSRLSLVDFDGSYHSEHPPCVDTDWQWSRVGVSMFPLTVQIRHDHALFELVDVVRAAAADKGARSRGMGMELSSKPWGALPLVGEEDGVITVRGLQSFDVRRNGSIDVIQNPAKFTHIVRILSWLHASHGCVTLLNLGCDAGLVSLLAAEVGYSTIFSLDDRPKGLAALAHIVSARQLGDALRPPALLN